MAHANRFLDEFADALSLTLQQSGPAANAAQVVEAAVEHFGSDDDAIHRALLDVSDELHPLELPPAVRLPLRAMLVTDASHGLLNAVVRYMRIRLTRRLASHPDS